MEQQDPFHVNVAVPQPAVGRRGHMEHLPPPRRSLLRRAGYVFKVVSPYSGTDAMVAVILLSPWLALRV